MARLYFKVFFNGGEQKERYTEALVIKAPLTVLSLLSLGFVFSANPINPDSSWLLPILSSFNGSAVAQHFSLIPVLSIALALAGLAFSYFYIEKKMFEGFVNGIKTLAYSVSNKNFYLDEIYKVAIVRGALLLAKAAYWWDQKVVDRVVNLIGEAQVVVAYLTGWFDRTVVDGGVKLLTWTVNFAGNRTRQMQGGNLQAYLAWAVFGLLLIFYFFELLIG